LPLHVFAALSKPGDREKNPDRSRLFQFGKPLSCVLGLGKARISILPYVEEFFILLVNSSLDVSMVSVTATSLREGSWVPHSPLNFTVSGFSAQHFGHLLGMAVPLFSNSWPAKENQGKEQESNYWLFIGSEVS